MQSNKEGTVLNLQVGNSMVLIKNNAIKLHADKIILNKKSIGGKIMNTREEILKIKNVITSEGWNALGINGTNADFEEVE